MSQVTINRAELATALSASARFANNKTWEDLRLVAVHGLMVISATDGSHWLELSVPCAGEMEAVCVNAQRIHDVVGSLIGEGVGLQLDGSCLKIFATKGKRSLAISPAASFPSPEFEAKVTVTLDADQIRDAMAFTLPSAASAADPGKWHLAGVRFFTEGRRLKVIGCDMHNLAMVEIGECTEEVGATISEKTAETASRLISGTVEMGFNERAAEIRWAGGRIFGSLIDADYISMGQIARVIDEDRPLSFSAESKELLAAIRAVRPIGFFDRLSRSTGIKLTLNGKATLSTNAAEGSAEQEFVADYEGEEIQVGFAAARMERILNSFGDAVLTVHLKDAAEPMKFEAAGRPDRVALLYPLRL